MIGIRCTVLAVLLAIGASATADTAIVPELGCLSYDRVGCGCSIRLDGIACPAPDASRIHLHSGAADGDPLWLVHDGREVALRSSRPQSQTFSFSAGDAWSESYAAADMTVAIAYRPGATTCNKPAPETCEYFDVDAEVTVETRGHRLQLRGTGTCGC